MTINKVSSFHPALLISVLALCTVLIGCSAMEVTPSASSHLRVDSSKRTFQVREYALVEASTDNPNHPGFQERARSAVAAQRAGWLFSNTDATGEPNKALVPFQYHIAGNPTPPFSGFALYQQDRLLQRDIARFWLVSPNGEKTALQDFDLSFETIGGEMMIASSAGIRPLPEAERSSSGLQKIVPSDQYVYSDKVSSEAGMVAGAPSLFESGPVANSFGQQMIGGQLFYFYSSGDLVHLNYAGKDLAYIYDQVVHANSGENAVYNPGGTGQVVWFYALRDGLWYYVEVGLFS